jgi:Flp pilus assembly protein TadG
MTVERTDKRQSRRLQRGDTLVEFALVSFVLMTIVIGILDFGRAVYAYSVVANCAREGARYGVIEPEDHAGIVATVQGKATGLDTSRLTVNVTNEESAITVSVSYDFQLITPLISDVLGSSSLTMASSATMYTGY